MLDSYFTYLGEDKAMLAARLWMPAKHQMTLNRPRAILQIVHGMSEHIGRYEHLAKVLTAAGIVVVGHDLRGHGQSVREERELGHFSGGWDVMQQDIYLLTKKLKSRFPDVPYLLFGHSFGSLAVRGFLLRHAGLVDGVILSGTSAPREQERKLGKLLLNLQLSFFTADKQARLVSWFTFRGFNKGLRPRATAFDWLSRDVTAIQSYMEDPRCGQICSLQFYQMMFEGMDEVFEEKAHGQLDPSLPVYIFAGDQDPVGIGSEGTEEAERIYNAAGLRDVTCRLYPGGRHEMLHETNREQVIEDLWHWINERF